MLREVAELWVTSLHFLADLQSRGSPRMQQLSIPLNFLPCLCRWSCSLASPSSSQTFRPGILVRKSFSPASTACAQFPKPL